MNAVRSQSGDKIRVLIVDDHAMVRQGLRTFLELQDDSSEPVIEVVGEAVNGIEAVELTSPTQPDIVLLDLVMPKMDGIQATAKILEVSPHSRIIILTSFGEEDKVIPAIQAGAHGYLLKDIAPDKLVEAIRNAHRGEVQLHPNAAKKLMAAVSQKDVGMPTHPAQPAVAQLTGREGEIIGMIAGGMNNREIAEKLVISEKTVKTHVSNILSKLHLEDRTQAAIYALKHGLGTDKE